MKKIILGCLLLLFAVPFALQAEERTLVGGKPEYGWYVAPVIKLTRINDEFSVITGVRSGAIFSHFLAAGIGVYGNIKLENDDSLVFIDYGGFDFEFIFLNNHPLSHTLFEYLEDLLNLCVPQIDTLPTRQKELSWRSLVGILVHRLPLILSISISNSSSLCS